MKFFLLFLASFATVAHARTFTGEWSGKNDNCTIDFSIVQTESKLQIGPRHLQCKGLEFVLAPVAFTVVKGIVNINGNEVGVSDPGIIKVSTKGPGAVFGQSFAMYPNVEEGKETTYWESASWESKNANFDFQAKVSLLKE